MSVLWCAISVIVGVLFIALGIAGRLKLEIPNIGKISGSVGAVLVVLGILFGMLGYCPL
jgi:hypothetical protein